MDPDEWEEPNDEDEELEETWEEALAPGWYRCVTCALRFEGL